MGNGKKPRQPANTDKADKRLAREQKLEWDLYIRTFLCAKISKLVTKPSRAMKTAIYFTMSCAILLCGSSFAEPTTPDTTAYKQSIMAFGISQQSAQQAAEKAVEDIQNQQAEQNQNEQDKHFANISDDIVNNPYGF